jgi:SAM-dependent methyltransferase
VSERDRYRLSFGSVAETYERARPLYAPDALAWLRGRLPLRRVLDLGAGTGKLSRQLASLGVDVVAVEPDVEMREVFARVLPDVELRGGSAESIPLPDGSVDAVTAGQAFHWFDVERAVPEIHRVLREHGGVALLWNHWNEGDAMLQAVDAVSARLRPTWAREDESTHPLEGSPLFANRELRTFDYVEELDPEVVIERLSSTSAFVNASAEERERGLAEIRGLIGERREFPAITTVAVADRV